MNKFIYILLSVVCLAGAYWGYADDEYTDDEEECPTGEDPPSGGPDWVLPSLFASSDEATGPRYRKIGLNGFPLPDEKPQQKAESDEEPEETYIDAFNHTLAHQVTDVYVPLEGTDFKLTVRRNWSPEIWQLASGLKPANNRPDRPFGAGWKSNLTAGIMFTWSTGSPPYAYVTDENGATYRFLMLSFTADGEKFFPMPEHRHQQEVLATKLEVSGSNSNEYIFTKKYGATLILEKSDVTIFTTDSIYRWARLKEAQDRYGTVLNFHFSGSDNSSLIPQSITCRGKELTITSANGRVTAVTDPNGQTTSYEYEDQTITVPGYPEYYGYNQTVNCLRSVKRADESETVYSYSSAQEHDQQPRTLDDPAWGNRYYYLDLETITDPLGHTTAISYAFDHTRRNYMSNEDYSGWYRPSGNPRNITHVSLPDGHAASFSNDSNVWLAPNELFGPFMPQGERVLNVTDAKGGNWTYTFTEGDIVRLDEFEDMVYADGDAMSQSIGLMVLYKKMTVDTPESGQMEATFDKAAGMALASFKDVGVESPTTYEYGDDFPFAFTFPSTWFPAEALAKIPTTKWGDPTKQTNGEGEEKAFTYTGPWRIMDSVTDEAHRTTHYNVNGANGNRISETISGTSGIQQTTTFGYGGGALSGILTIKTVKTLSGDPEWAQDLVTDYDLDSYGNILREIRGTGTTQYTYDANNNKTSTTDPNGHVTTFTYDELNRLTAVAYAGSGTKTFTYDARGNKIREDDENGHSTLREYDALNRVVKEARDMNGSHTIDGPDLVTQYTYNALNAKTSVTTPNGHTTTMEYDGLNRLVQTTDPDGNETLYAYGTNSGGLQFGRDFQPVKVTDPRGYETFTTYDANFRPTEKKVQYAWSGSVPVHATTAWEYDAVGNMIRETDPLGRDTEKTYDALNRETSTLWADGTGTQTHYTHTGLKWKTVDELGGDTLTEYDDQGRPVKVSSPVVEIGNTGTLARAVTQTVYDAASNPVQTINPLGFVWSSTFDSRNRKVAEVRPGAGSPTLHWAYDAVGNVTQTTDARGNATDTEYDEANRPVTITQPAVSVAGSGTARPVTTKGYDKNGNATSVTDPNGHETVNTYDVLNRLVATTDAEGITVTNEYDPVGNRTAVLDGKNQRNDFEYDGLNRNTKTMDAAGKSTVYEYNALNKTARVDAKNQRTEYGYDLRNRLIAVSYPGRTQDNRAYAYDAAGNLLAVTEPDESKAGKANVAYSYDALKRQLTETSGGLTHTYKYDLAGNRLYCLYGGLGVPLVSAYDAQNRLSTLTQGALVTTYTYDLDGNTLAKTLPNGDAAASQFDALSRTTSLAGSHGATPLYGYAYQYDAAGNVKQVAETYSGTGMNRVVSNTYDAVDRLTQEAVTGNGAGTTSFAYDDAHNRSQMVKSGTTTSYTYNSRNQLTSFGSGTSAVTLAYDDNGNRTARITASGTDSYGWDYENRLVSLDKQSAEGAGTYGWTYDYRTRRVELACNGDITKIVFSGGTSVREFENGTPTVDYVRGSDWGGGVGGILYSLRGGVPSFTHYNRRGDVTAKTDATGAITYQSQYEAFGKRTTETGATADRQKSNTKDEDIPGYANEGFRFRDLETGIFLTKDPAGFVDGPNLYAYVQQNPWTTFDPEGLQEAVLEGAVLTNPIGASVAVTGAVVFTGYGAYKQLEKGFQTAQGAKSLRDSQMQTATNEQAVYGDGKVGGGTSATSKNGNSTVTQPAEQGPTQTSGSAEPQKGGTRLGGAETKNGGSTQVSTPGGQTSQETSLQNEQVHGNSNKSTKPQQVYEIRDANGNLIKVGISGQTPNADGSSPRADSQVRGTNNTATVVENIPGGEGARMKAKESEQQRVDDYARKNGGKGPPGNKRPQPRNQEKD